MKRLAGRKPSIYVWLALSLSLLAIVPIGATLAAALVLGSNEAITITAVLSGLLGLILVALMLRLLVTQPLAGTAKAARRIAGGHLGVSFPSSHVGEIDDVQFALNHMSAELAESQARREALESERRLLISGIAHDLRTPLFALTGYLEGLETGIAKTPESAARYIQGARERAQRLDRLIGQLLDFARLEYLARSPDPKPVDLSRSLARILDDFRSSADSKGVKLVTECPEGPCLIFGDEELLTRALGNLLDNALRYSPSGGCVEVAWGLEGGNAWISVADSGPGISPADLPHIFRPAFRGDAARHSNEVGAGLGLTIASRIIEAHGGHLEAENRPGGGARFKATISAHPGPASPTHEQRDDN